jgi:hypothetical protein
MIKADAWVSGTRPKVSFMLPLTCLMNTDNNSLLYGHKPSIAQFWQQSNTTGMTNA